MHRCGNRGRENARYKYAPFNSPSVDILDPGPFLYFRRALEAVVCIAFT